MNALKLLDILQFMKNSGKDLESAGVYVLDSFNEVLDNVEIVFIDEDGDLIISV